MSSENAYEFELAFEAGNGEELIENLKKGMKPDLVLLDIQMPIMDGITALGFLGQFYPSIKVIVLSMINSQETVAKVMQMGACAYLTKELSSDEILKAMETVLKKGYYYTDLVTNSLLTALQTLKGNSSQEASNVALSGREMQIVKLICNEKTQKEIAHELNLSPRTIEAHRDNIYTKLGISNQVGLVIWAIKNGVYNSAKVK